MIIKVNPNKKNKICSPVIGFEAENKVTGFEFDYSDVDENGVANITVPNLQMVIDKIESAL